MKIYTTFEPVPSRMLALVRLLLTAGTLDDVELVRLLQPRENTAQAEKTLDAAHQCGLVLRKGKQCSVTPGLFSEGMAPSGLDDALPVVLGRLLLRADVGGEANGFAILCAWLLSQPIQGMPQDRGALKRAIEEQGLPLSELQIQNDARWDNVIYWARYLGLIRQMGDGACVGLLPDPSMFLRRHLAELVPSGADVPAAEFRVRLGQLCPVLDGGAVRDGLLQRCMPDWPASRISGALAFGIERLERTGDLRAWCPDDQRAFVLTPEGRKIAYLAHP
jgi:hypothetical protein